MNINIIIPAHNEEDNIGATLQSLVDQTLLPKKIIVINDASTDNTQSIISRFSSNYRFIKGINHDSGAIHEPGSKVINAFYKGFPLLDDDYDVLCKYDADLIFPSNYLERIADSFNNDSSIGMAGGFCYIEKNGNWVLESLTNKDHIRGALKAYRKSCFEDIGGLKNSMGWDTIDELLAQYHGWRIKTDPSLHVKHLKPTGKAYSRGSRFKQGEAFYKMRYGFLLTTIASGKLAFKKRSPKFFFDCISGYRRSKKRNIEYLITEPEGKFIRDIRWKGIKERIGIK